MRSRRSPRGEDGLRDRLGEKRKVEWLGDRLENGLEDRLIML